MNQTFGFHPFAAPFNANGANWANVRERFAVFDLSLLAKGLLPDGVYGIEQESGCQSAGRSYKVKFPAKGDLHEQTGYSDSV
jgi:hypothetical protein